MTLNHGTSQAHAAYPAPMAATTHAAGEAAILARAILARRIARERRRPSKIDPPAGGDTRGVAVARPQR
jgi:hypothetical protein